MTQKLLEALYFATNKHNGQTRKDKETPFISHPLSVAIILSRVTDDEDIIIAGMLHDIVEDTKTTLKDIEKLFGKRVSLLVKECTEEDRSLSWHERKKAVLAKINKISKDGALVKSADILHNLYEMNHKMRECGKEFANNFNASFEDKLRYDVTRLEKLKKYHSNSLLKEIEMQLIDLQKLAKEI